SEPAPKRLTTGALAAATSLASCFSRQPSARLPVIVPSGCTASWAPRRREKLPSMPTIVHSPTPGSQAARSAARSSAKAIAPALIRRDAAEARRFRRVAPAVVASISRPRAQRPRHRRARRAGRRSGHASGNRSEEHTSELQSRENLVCRLLLEKKKRYYTT